MANMASICWGMSHIAFEASNDNRFPNQMQRAFGIWGAYWVQTAIFVQGDALKWWLDFWHETAQLHVKKSFAVAELASMANKPQRRAA